MTKKRVDMLLVEKGLVESRTKAQRLVMAGQVRADGELVSKPAMKVSSSAHLEIERSPKYVSRGGEKLAGALNAFGVKVKGKVCADVGASTGGFTDCLLQNDAAKVYAIDVGYGILHWKLRNHPRVVVMERTNARFIDRLPEPIKIVTVDASFISLKLLLPVIKGWLDSESGTVIALIKPQFEAGKKEATRGAGVIRDSKIHQIILKQVLSSAQEEGYAVEGIIRSPLIGPKGNIEFFAWLSVSKEINKEMEETINRWIREVIGK